MSFWRRFSRNRGAVVGLFLIVVALLAGVFAPMITPSDPFSLVGTPFLAPGSDEFLLGTDSLGRDILSQLVYGARISFVIGLFAAGVSVVVGMTIGAISGYFGGAVDVVLMRLTEMFQVLPQFVVALVVVALLGNGLVFVILVIGLLAWPPTARLVRAQFLSIKEQEFVTAARALGVRTTKIIFSEVLPNAIPAVIVVASLDVAKAILIEAGLSYLGLGDPDVMSWGTMLQNAQRFLQRAWWLSVLPGSAIFLLVLAFNLVGDGLNEALNPRLRER